MLREKRNAGLLPLGKRGREVLRLVPRGAVGRDSGSGESGV